MRTALSIILGLISLPMYVYCGDSANLLFAPIVFLMIFSKRVEYFPGLVIYLIAQSNIVYILLIACLFVSVFHFRYFWKFDLGWIFILLLAPLPLFAYLVYVRIFEVGLSYGPSFHIMSYYLGLFPFFYGFLISKKCPEIPFLSIALALVTATLAQAFKIYDHTVRVVFFAFPFLVCFLMFYDFNQRSSKFLKSIRALLVLILVAFFVVVKDATLTILGATVFSIVLIFSYYLSFRPALKLLSTKIPFILSIVVVWAAVVFVKDIRNTNIDLNVEAYKYKLTSFSNASERFLYKMLGDRAPIWRGAWLQVASRKSLLPPSRVVSYDVESTPVSASAHELPAHNIYLELLKEYGLLLGPLVGVLFIFLVSKVGLVFTVHHLNQGVLILSATILGVGVIGGMAGTFPLIPQFSFLYMGLVGLCYGYYVHYLKHQHDANA